MKNQDKSDLIIIGAGPSALTAAIYAARECLSVTLVEKAMAGGQAAITDMIDNYPGFPDGVNGFELADRMRRQAERFGVVIEQDEVDKIEVANGSFTVMAGSRVFESRSVLISTGSSYMKLGIKGEADFYGKGVHYCATCDGAFYKGRNIAVIGGGNSAVQEAIFLTKFVSHIDLISLYKLSASEILQTELQKYVKSGQISIHEDTKTKEIMSENGKLAGIRVVAGGKDKDLKLDGVFVFIGLKPNTQFLDGSDIKLDERGFIKTDLNYMTNISGIFASGDVRSGAIMQVACAVGEGAAAALAIREYLNN